jgi:light-regulated signal transduction histidine kinase (bacteriophytochrome)
MDVKASFLHLQGQNIVMKIGRDISKLKEQQNAIQEQNERLKEIAWTQSHIVRAPLAKIMGATELIASSQLSLEAEAKELLQALQLSAKELDDVIREITEKTYQ